MKALLCALAGLAVVAGGVHLWRQGEPFRGFDFVTFYAAATLATTDECAAVYDRFPGDESRVPDDGALARAARQTGYPTNPGQFYNLPICLLLLKPFTWLSYPGAYRLMSALSLAAVVLTVWLSVRVIAPRASPMHTWLGFAVLCVLACFSHPVAYNSVIGNFSALLTLGYVAAFYLDARRRSLLAGLVLGVSIIFKPSPLPLVLFFALRGRWRTAGSAVVTVAVLVVAGLVYYGPAMHLRWWELMGFYSDRTFAAWNDQSLLAGLLRFTVPDIEIVTWKVTIAPAWVRWTQRLVLLLLVAWWLSAFRRWRSTRGAVVGYGVGMLLISIAPPFAWTHYFAVIIWPVAIVAAALFGARRKDIFADVLLLALVVVAWMANPERVFELARYRLPVPGVGPWLARCLVSNTLAAAVVLVIWLQTLQRQERPARG